MPRPARPWFRFYVEAMRDPKIRRLTPEQRWLWVGILSAARESPISGYLMVSDRHAYDWTDLADYAGMKVKVVEQATELMNDLGMIAFDERIGAWYVRAWSDRQFESDDVTARTRRHKERSSEPDRNVPTSAVGTGLDTETETDTESDTESPSANRATTAPSHMLITEPMRKWASSKGLRFSLDEETERFLDFHRSKGSKFKDWTAAWRTWMSRAEDYKPRRNGVDPTRTEYV